MNCNDRTVTVWLSKFYLSKTLKVAVVFTKTFTCSNGDSAEFDYHDSQAIRQIFEFHSTKPSIAVREYIEHISSISLNTPPY